VRSGEREKALDALATFETWAASSDALWARARLASARALVLGGDEANEQYEEALRLADDGRPFDVARIHLLYGEHLRRARRRTDARVELRAALDGFERLDAEPWAARTRSALRATGETARKRDPSTINQLTPQELQIARHVAEGMSNKEIAALLFLSPRTIDSHLRNIFGKLDITSRIQLARIPLGRDLERESQVSVEASG
jgi:DNA-binding NarL/FixJ family response regulator